MRQALTLMHRTAVLEMPNGSYIAIQLQDGFPVDHQGLYLAQSLY